MQSGRLPAGDLPPAGGDLRLTQQPNGEVPPSEAARLAAIASPWKHASRPRWSHCKWAWLRHVVCLAMCECAEDKGTTTQRRPRGCGEEASGTTCRVQPSVCKRAATVRITWKLQLLPPLLSRKLFTYRGEGSAHAFQPRCFLLFAALFFWRVHFAMCLYVMFWFHLQSHLTHFILGSINHEDNFSRCFFRESFLGQNQWKQGFTCYPRVMSSGRCTVSSPKQPHMWLYWWPFLIFVPFFCCHKTLKGP